jgi:hypothetical protein
MLGKSWRVKSPSAGRDKLIRTKMLLREQKVSRILDAFV